MTVCGAVSRREAVASQGLSSVFCEGLGGVDVSARDPGERKCTDLRLIRTLYGRNQHSIVKQLSSN